MLSSQTADGSISKGARVDESSGQTSVVDSWPFLMCCCEEAWINSAAGLLLFMELQVVQILQRLAWMESVLGTELAVEGEETVRRPLRARLSLEDMEGCGSRPDAAAWSSLLAYIRVQRQSLF